ncbi:RNA-guided endonuclease InsQ/TnpB family protein, partial [Aphanothece hegewaldii]|uniref:RNA-guided endonuclease InsQ/TnpB family protein n=1 Tax=Aphanothece hegewaldii TaxID=1521625 RepID=UPI002481EFAE
MIITYCYKLRPNKNQVAKMQTWLELLRRHYNYCLGQRFGWWEHNRCDVNACPLTCSITPLADRPNYYSQQNQLPNTKTLFPEYKNIHSQVLQNCVKRVELAFSRFVNPDATGRRFGKPRFKGKGRYRSFTFSQMKNDCIDGNKIKLPKIGEVKFIYHRQIPTAFVIKTATISLKADGWYIALVLEDKSVPVFTPDESPNQENTLGIDLGLIDFLVDDRSDNEPIPQYYRKSQDKLAKLQKKLSSKKKGSKRRAKAVQKVAKHHKKVGDKRKHFHHQVANKLVNKAKFIGCEDLNIKGLAKSRLAKSVNDAGWGSFISILKLKAANAGGLVIEVDPRGTSQECSSCEANVAKTLADRWHSCPNCGLELQRDHNSAIIIKKRTLAVGHPVIGKKPNAQSRETEKPPLYPELVEGLEWGVCH